MLFCRSGDTTSGFVGYFNGIEVCWFDMLGLIMGSCFIIFFIWVLICNKFAKSQKSEVKG